MLFCNRECQTPVRIVSNTPISRKIDVQSIEVHGLK
ncbi:hypothetical protein M7I_3176 [Glarea lozoyensis 74030]|uniref:Uncharacterized protein n=1 Tax=Glarea lozoyensis (strain ATCC 74030 / MF5533) TaxID=1104152 RepID=H0EKU4_GLAL7|nr:hypothetical protein M7I_3176 [Glarea lozoyensis 74030]